MAKRDPRDERRGRDRYRRMVAVVSILFALLAVRLFILQHLRHEKFSQYAQENQLQRERIVSPRGLIKDRDGVVLVDNVPAFDIIVPWRSERDVRETVDSLFQYVPLDTALIYARFALWQRRNRGLPFPAVPDADKYVISFVKENYDLFPKLRVESNARRRYRRGDFAAHLLGYVGEVSDQFLEQSKRKGGGYYAGDIVGRTGLESVAESHLRGEDGQRVVAVNASGRVLGELKELLKPPQPGKDVYLTIDADLQGMLEELIEPYGAGAAVVMNVNDGALLAAVSMPQFNPNSFAGGIAKTEWDELNSAESKPLFNRFLRASYPPGSTFKVVSSYAVLTERMVAPDEAIVYCTGQHRFGNRVFKCWRSWGHGYMNLLSGTVQSCDSYFYKVAEVTDVDVLAESARLFGLGSRTGIDLPNEIQGLVPDRKYYNRRFGKGKWTQGLVLNNIIGQGEFLASVLQMARVAAAVGNGGYLVQPHVIQRVEGEPTGIHPRKRVRGLDGDTLARIRRSMVGVVHDEDGTARGSRVQGIRAAGKTGTSQNPHGEDHAWFIGYVPADDPEIAIAIIVENAGHGGAIAAPMAGKAYREYFKKPEVAAAKPPAQPKPLAPELDVVPLPRPQAEEDADDSGEVGGDD